MNTKKTLGILGIILILIQALSFAGMSKMYVGLYPDRDDLLYPQYIKSSDLNITEVFFAIDAGLDRFKTGFEDLSYNEYDYRIMTVKQMTSAMIRESLGCSSDGSTGLTIYDTVLTISYFSTGIIGVILFIVSRKAVND